MVVLVACDGVLLTTRDHVAVAQPLVAVKAVRVAIPSAVGAADRPADNRGASHRGRGDGLRRAQVAAPGQVQGPRGPAPVRKRPHAEEIAARGWVNVGFAAELPARPPHRRVVIAHWTAIEGVALA